MNGFEAWIETPAGRFPISDQLYGGDVRAPGGADRLAAFAADPWPRWTFRLEDGTIVEQEIFVARESAATVVAWRLARSAPSVALSVRPLLSGRDAHELHHENPAFHFEPVPDGWARRWTPYEGVPSVSIDSNGEYSHEPLWYRRFLYTEERSRGLDFSEDLAAPGMYRFDLSSGEAVMILEAGPRPTPAGSSPAGRAAALRSEESRRRAAFGSRLERAADDYVARRGSGRTILAGYPWFLDWGRDTFVSVRGLCLATGRLEEARAILGEWTGAISAGMVPNRFPDRGEVAEYNSVDASLWFAIAVYEYLSAGLREGHPATEDDRRILAGAVDGILRSYAAGTRYGIHADGDGLLAAGAPGVQLTWMDAKIGDRVVTPRIGKPVEVQALWINALSLAGREWAALANQAAGSFAARFWDENAGFLADVVDAGHIPGADDRSFRPNQIFAVGGLPIAVIRGTRARRVVDAVERRLWTPVGLRSLDPGDPAYVGQYRGGVAERDAAYHQGTVWPWLLGPFVEAWVRVRGDDERARNEARRRFLDPLLRHVGESGLGHLPEVADGDAPHRPGGCPFQAWSVGEALRLDRDVLSRERPPLEAGDRSPADRDPAPPAIERE